ncbi:MAG: acyltransferase [Nitrospirales bacterium]|nr:acyltransferase [Nitrospira sp.]MDR4502051.1 acyltransferase [Nitrospirales bacterium]
MIHREISDKKFHINSLDGLRGFAALIVVFSHTSNSGMFFIPFLDLRGIGKSGVFLFFLLSSFLLTLPLLHKGKDILTISAMSHYWQRRFFRIYPLYTLYLLLGLISSFVISRYLGMPDIGVPFFLDFPGFVNHFLLLEGKGVTWSIAVEFKFYFILPLLVIITVFIRSYGFLSVILFFIVLIICSQIISPQHDSLTNDSRLLPYMPIFIIGVLLAVLQDYIHNSQSNEIVVKICRHLGYIGLVGVVAMTPLVISLFGNRVPNNYLHKEFILYSILWSFVLLSSINYKGLIRKFFTLPILRFYGALSFSLYLFHPIFLNIIKRLEINGYASFWLVLLSSTIAAYFSFKIIEEPASKYGAIDPPPPDRTGS